MKTMNPISHTHVCPDCGTQMEAWAGQTLAEPGRLGEPVVSRCPPCGLTLNAATGEIVLEPR